MARRPKKRVAKRSVSRQPAQPAQQGGSVPAPPRQPLHNLPTQLTSFIGREHEIAEIKRLLGTTRLLTLRGSGGCGKTRLALQVPADLGEHYPDGLSGPLVGPSRGDGRFQSSRRRSIAPACLWARWRSPLTRLEYFNVVDKLLWPRSRRTSSSPAPF